MSQANTGAVRFRPSAAFFYSPSVGNGPGAGRR